MNLSKFYEDKDRLAYNPRERLSFKRTGLKRLISFDDRFIAVSQELERLIRSFNEDQIKVLDIGIGDGVYESLLPQKLLDKIQIYGIDLSKNQLARSKKFTKEARVLDLNEQKLPYKDGTFHLIIVSELLEHIFFPEMVLNEAWRTLRPGGYILLTYPNSGSLQLKLALLTAGASPLLNYPRNKEHIRFFNQKDILSLFKTRPKIAYYQGLGSFLFDRWNFSAKIPMPRLLQILGNKFLPGLALGQLLVIKK